MLWLLFFLLLFSDIVTVLFSTSNLWLLISLRNHLYIIIFFANFIAVFRVSN